MKKLEAGMKKEKKEKKTRKRQHSIGTTLMASFASTVVLMILLGVVSYNIASTVVLTKYKQSAVSTVEAVGEYFNLVCDTISGKAIELVMEGDMADYYNTYYDNTSPEAITLLRKLKTTLTNLLTSNTLISDCAVIPEEGTYITTISGAMTEQPYLDFVKSPEGSYLDENQAVRNVWRGYHTYIDENLLGSREEYCMTFFQKFTRKKTVLVLDVDMQVFDDMAEGMDFGSGSIKALISSDGREITRIQGSEEAVTENYFIGKNYYEKIRSAETSGVDDKIVLNGEKYVFIYSPITEADAVLCVLIPERNMLGEINTIKYVTAGIVLIAGIAALCIGLVISLGIGRTVKSMSDGISTMEKGDLTIDFVTKRKDEFQTLTKSLNSMLLSLRNLVKDMKNFGSTVMEMSENVYQETEAVNTSMKGITTAMSEVADGIQNQAEETEKSNEKMIALSGNIDAVTDKANYMVKTADQTIATVERGKDIVAAINETSAQTVAITKVLVKDIGEVQKQSYDISGIVDIINNIAEQTNLLSLNASIEAARAGDAGRGFAVVAEEIRHLADQSNESGNRIRMIVEHIGQTSGTTAASVKKAEGMVLEQAKALQQTVEVFTAIHESVLGLVADIRLIMERLGSVASEKDMVQESIQNISAVSQQVSAAAEEVTATVEDQAEVMNLLAQEVEKLKLDVNSLNDSIDRFMI